MMLGEYFCMLAYGVGTWRSGSAATEESKPKTEGNPKLRRLFFAIPATFDVLGSTCNFFGLARVAASVYQMMRAFMIVVTATFSVIFLKKKYYVHHMIGICLVLGGVLIVGTVTIHGAANTPGAATTDPIGVVFLLTAQLFSGCMMVSEEKFIKGTSGVSPLLAIGLEGLSGCSILIVMLPFLSLIPCVPVAEKGVDKACPYGVIEDSVAAVAQILGEAPLCLLVVGSMISIAFFNFFGISITKVLSSSSRAVIDPTRTLFIWLMSILLGWESFLYLQLLGFLISTIGMLIFNEIIPLPFWGIDYNWSKKIEARNKKRKDYIETGILKAIEPAK